jgi:hypothetical protein
MQQIKKLGVIPSVRKPHEISENTIVDAVPTLAIGTHHERRSPSTSRTSTPPNVIPFTKPRAIAAVAAANPKAVELRDTTVAEPLNPGFTLSWTVDSAAMRAHKPGTVTPTALPARPAPAAKAPVSAKVAATPRSEGTSHHQRPTGGAVAWPVPVPYIPPPAQPQPAQPAKPVAQAVTVIGLPPITAMPPPAPAIAPAPAPAAPAPESKWNEFEQLGLVQPAAPQQRLSKIVVSLYRVLGFSILTIIVAVLIGYIVMTAFYYFSDSWIVPVAIQPSDDKVVTLQAQLAEQQNSRDKIANDLDQAERAIKSQQAFQAAYAKAIRGDLANRKVALTKLRDLAQNAKGTRAAVRASNAAFAGAAQKKMAQEYASGLIDRNGMLSGRFQLAQISTSNLTLAERQAEYENRAAELEAQTRSLDAILEDQNTEAELSYDVLRIKQEFEASKLELSKAIETRDTLKAALARQDQVVNGIKRSSYLRALNDHATVAFVPYGNLKNAPPHTKLYACKIGMFWCHSVGEVIEVLPGEVVFRHPHRDKNLRGQMVELRLDDPAAAENDVMFVGGKPLLL